MSLNRSFIMPHEGLLDSKNSAKEAIHVAANRSVRPYSTNQEYLYAMREDLADWLKGLYAIEIGVANFFEMLQTGTVLCQHANNITSCAKYTQKNNGLMNYKHISKIPSSYLNFNQIKNGGASSFFARDNVANFIKWCRNELAIHESLMFETDDLVQRKNEKNFILCLLEVARRGSKFGVPAPVLIQMEEEIDEEIELEKVSKEKNIEPKKPVKQKVVCDFKSLDEMVQYILGMCTCPTQFPMVRVSDGKYKVGGSENLIFMRILRQHVMVRVGGGWDTLEQYLNKHDPCRCQQHRNDRNLASRHNRSSGGANVYSSKDRSSVSNKEPRNGGSSHAFETSPRSGVNTYNEMSPVRKYERKQHSGNRQFRNLSSTPTPESKYSRGRQSQLAADNSKNRSSIKSDSQPNVFNRLSRPKSTPPVTRDSVVRQDDMLLVQRNKSGSHHIQRAKNVSEVENSARNTPGKRTETRGYTKSKSVSSTAPLENAQRTSTAKRISRQRRSQSVDNDKNHRSRSSSSSPRKQCSSFVNPLHEEIDAAKEREMLEAFERECIANQQTMEMRQRRRRKSSIDNLLDTHSFSTSNAEDSEVAFHMMGCNDEESSLSNTYHSLPRPRKDKVGQHERRTKIPTPVSFNRPLTHGRDIDLNDVEKQDVSDHRTESTASRKFDGDDVTSRSRASAFANDINRLLDPCQFTHENELAPKYTDSIALAYADPNFPPSSYSVTQQSRDPYRQQALRHQESFSPSSTSRSYSTLPRSRSQYKAHSLDDDLRGNYDGCRSEMTSRIPPHILETCNLTSAPHFNSDASHNDFPTSREAQWV